VRAATFLESTLVRDGRLLRTWRDGKAHLLAYADDYAFLAQACLDLYEATFDLRWLERSLHWSDQLVDLFWDHAEGGLFYTGKDAEALVATSKHPIGGAEPSANGVAALTFARLAVMSGREDLGEKSDRILRSLQGIALRAPRALGPELVAYAWRTSPPRELGIAGDPDGARELLAELRKRVLPLTVRAVVASDTPLVPWMAERPRNRGRATAYLCEAMTCQLPTSDPKELAGLLDDQPKEAPPLRDHAPELPSDPAAWIHSPPMSLADLRGNVVVLDFWTYCCINCMHVLPVLDEIERAFEGQPLVVIGVHASKFPAEGERDNVVRAVARHHVRHPVVLDPDHDLWDRYAVRAWPSLVVLDTTGRIAWRKSGEVTREELHSVVRRLLDDARADGTLGTARVTASVEREDAHFLSFPGKVSVFPGPQAQVRGVAAWSDDTHLYVSDTGHHRIHEAKLTLKDGWPSAHLVRTFGSGSPGLVDGAHAQFRGPQGTSRAENALWVADTENHALRRIDLATGVTETIAGTGELGRGQPDFGDPRKLRLRSPWDVEAEGRLVFIAMAGSHQIWVHAEGRVGPIAGSGREDHVDGSAPEAALAQPSGLVLSGRYLFFADSEVSSIRLFDLQERKVGTVVGAGLFDFGDVDGPPEQVRLQHPLDVTVSGTSLYVADTFNGKVKAISLEDGTTRTLASGFAEPGGIDSLGGFLFVADTNHHRVCVIRPESGEVRELPLHLPL
jgi:thiol-disulfide isomerase/thioredoxin